MGNGKPTLALLVDYCLGVVVEVSYREEISYP